MQPESTVLMSFNSERSRYLFSFLSRSVVMSCLGHGFLSCGYRKHYKGGYSMDVGCSEFEL